MMHLRSFLKHFAGIYLAAAAVFTPFTFRLISVQENISRFLFSNITNFLLNDIGKLSIKQTNFDSDSVSTYLLFALLMIPSFIIAVVLFNSGTGKTVNRMCYWLLVYYLSAILMKYGADKLFRTQFYIPEPNTLYTAAGNLDKDILYWTSMGSSKIFNIVTGSLEILAALFLMVSKTRLAGILTSGIILLQVVLINIAFDISVKLFSCFLLLTAVYLWLPYSKRVIQAVLTNKAITKNSNFQKIVLPKPVQQILKTILITLIFSESFGQYISTKNFNAGIAEKPLLHRAYNVLQSVSVSPKNDSSQLHCKRFFIHGRGYLVLQLENEKMVDYKIETDSLHQRFQLTGYDKQQIEGRYEKDSSGNELTLYVFGGEATYVIKGKSLGWEKMPLLKDSFHLFSDR